MFDHGVHGPAPRPQRQSRGPIIEEVDGSDGEEEKNGGDREQVERPRKDSRSSDEPWVQHPDDEVGGGVLFYSFIYLFLYFFMFLLIVCFANYNVGRVRKQ